MPTTSTIPQELKELLKKFKTNLSKLSCHTGIPRARLIRIFLASDFTHQELLTLLDKLQPQMARAFIVGAQKGNFNQAGTGNKQRVKIVQHVTYNVTHNVLIQVNTPKEPEPTALGSGPQRWGMQQIQPGGQVHQIGAAVPVQELGRAA